MAREEIFFGVNIDTGQSIKKFGELKDRTKLLKKELDGLKVGSKRFNDIKKEITANQATIRRFNRELRDTKSLATRVGQGVTNAFKGVGTAFAGAFAISSIKSFVTESINAFDKQQKAVKKVEQAIVSTNRAAGLSLKQLTAEATALQDKTIFGDEDILNNATAQLLTFTNITEDNFLRTQKVALDLATVLDGDLKSASIQLGKALNDPVANLSALSRSGIQFSKEQKAVIKELAETNRLAEAQGVILKELERQYGGQAEAAAEAGAGGFQQLSNSIGDLTEAFGGLIVSMADGTGQIKETTNSLTAFVEEFTQGKEAISGIQDLGFDFGTADFLREDVRKTFTTLLTQQQVFNQQIQKATEEQDKALLLELAKTSRERLNQILETGKAAGDATGESVLAFKNLYIQQIQEILKTNKLLSSQIGDLGGQTQTVGLIEEIQAKIKDLGEASKKASSEEELARLNKELKTARQELERLNNLGEDLIITPKKSELEITGSFGRTLGILNDKYTELKPPIKEVNQEFIEQLLLVEKIENALIDLSMGLGEASIGFRELADQQADGSKKQQQLTKKSIRLAQLETAANRSAALASAFKGLGNSIALPPPANIAAVASTLGLIVSTFASFKALSSSVKFQRGGILKGASHANGGVPVKMANGGMVEAEGGEAIINKKSTAMFSPILSAINSYGGNGDKFERGGLLGTPSTTKIGDTTNAQLLGALNNVNFNPTVSVVEINEAQTRITELNTSSQL